jgi:putative SOS response-associated peptidase YedK
LTGLVERYPSAEEVGQDLEVYPVSTRVNNAQENHPGLIEPVSQ